MITWVMINVIQYVPMQREIGCPLYIRSLLQRGQPSGVGRYWNYLSRRWYKLQGVMATRLVISEPRLNWILAVEDW